MSQPTTQIAARTPAGAVQPVSLQNGALRVASEFALPPYDSRTHTYHGTTNNRATTTYALAGTNVARIDFAYVGGVPATDNARELSATLVLL